MFCLLKAVIGSGELYLSRIISLIFSRSSISNVSCIAYIRGIRDSATSLSVYPYIPNADASLASEMIIPEWKPFIPCLLKNLSL